MLCPKLKVGLNGMDWMYQVGLDYRTPYDAKQIDKDGYKLIKVDAMKKRLIRSDEIGNSMGTTWEHGGNI